MKLNERELLELAAKAGGIDIIEFNDEYGYAKIKIEPHNDGDCYFIWNPLKSSGDALELAVKLEINVIHSENYKCACVGMDGMAATEEIGSDPLAATCLAITRAAAQIELDKGRKT